MAFTGQVDTEIPLGRARFTLRADLPATQTADLADGEKVPMLNLPTTGVSATGNSFSVAVAPADVPDRYVGANGLVSLELEIYDPQSDSYAWTTQSVRIVGDAAATRSASARSWADPLASGRSATARSAASRAPKVNVHLGKAPKGAKAAFMSRTDTCTTTKIGQNDAWATIGEGFPAAPGYGRNRGTAWMTHSDGSEVTYGAAITTNGTKWSASGSSSVANTKGFNFQWDPDTNPNIAYRAEARYYKYKYDCGGVIINRKVKAVSETGGVKTIHVDANPPYWLSRGTVSKRNCEQQLYARGSRRVRTAAPSRPQGKGRTDPGRRRDGRGGDGIPADQLAVR
ncbi:hypothetical protein [Streptomyces turgidiscabies]|uniref:Uncharacterized protein n=1 Tax=Streptomyces turgidiscabies TaxID=85558 RepID=A0ABU0RKZ3_9ACTN|nr:hypothetical protein [Streptomyces turgidiscabies]MDQ0932630.1 hypothetical protein [Streptomyces turgidiscabies]